MQWFPFQCIKLHTADKVECPSEHFKWLLILFLMFNIRIICDETIDNKDVPETVGIMCINCGKLLVVCYTIKTHKTSSLLLSQLW